MKPPNPLSAIFAVRKSELPLTLMMFSYFFLVITSFWILKPLKKSLFIQYYDQQGFSLFTWHLAAAQAELLAKVLNMVVAFAAVVVFTWLARRFRRQQLTFIFTSFFLLSDIVYSLLVGDPGPLTVWSFYLFGDLFSTLMVATFFAFLNDSVTPDAAKRLYGPVGLGGVVGGVVGTTFVSGLIEAISLSCWLWICVSLNLLILMVAYTAGRLVACRPELGPLSAPQPTVPDDIARDQGGNAGLEGAKLALRSPYLLAIVGIVGLYEIVSTTMDFQFTSTIAHYLDGPAIGRQFATVFTITNIVSMCVQLFLTSWIMTRFGIMTALLVLPLATLAGSGAFMAVPVLWVGSLLNTVDNGFSYSINQSAKEALYVPTTQDEKYKAKAFIDMFVQRLAKAVAVAVSLGITVLFKDFASLRWLSVFTIGIIAIWIVAARYAGKCFQRLEETVERA
jgi:ATP:ADP antiporter, AAA family